MNKNCFTKDKFNNFIDRDWKSIYNSFQACNNNYYIPDLAYFYLLKRAKQKFYELL